MYCLGFLGAAFFLVGSSDSESGRIPFGALAFPFFSIH
jgi:hypothetical protein